ncbi:MAG: 16S rRNA (cytosine(1402)-N(4))-methyltransferase RsmH [Planctomycetota bacterium]
MTESSHRSGRRVRYTGTHPRRFVERYKELDPDRHPGMHAVVRARGGTPAGTHVAIMVPEVLAVLALRSGDIVADATLGHGGHALELWRRVAPAGRLIGFDVDQRELDRASARLRAAGVRLTVHRMHYAGLGSVLASDALDGYDAILADLGCSSMQLDDPARGFSYKHDGPLDMRMDDRLRTTAGDLIRELSQGELSAALRDLADEPDHERIAARIAFERARSVIASTRDLRRVVFAAKGITQEQWRERARRDQRTLHPAARTFQALRILVNDELRGLEQFLRVLPYCLRPGGRVAVLSFHRGEDERVAEAFRAGRRCGIYAAIAEAPLKAGAAERRSNPRSGSARLRWAQRDPSCSS